MKLDSKALQFTDLLAKPIDDIVKLAKQGVAIATRAKNANEEHKDSAPAMGKILCVLEENLERGKRERLFPTSKSLNEYFGDVTGGKIRNHWYQTKDCFGAFVRTGFITEADYDNCSANALEIAGAIFSAVSKNGGDLTHPALAKAAEMLKSRPDGYTKALRSVLESIKPREPMDAEVAKERLAQILADGHLVVVIHQVGAEIANLEKPDDVKAAFLATEQLVESFDRNTNLKLTDDMRDAWVREAAEAEERRKRLTAPLTVVTENGSYQLPAAA